MKKVPGYKHLYRRGKGGTLYFRRSVPAYARAIFDGKTEAVVSLETSNIIEARYRLTDQDTIFEAKLRKAKLHPPKPISAATNRQPTNEEIEAEVRIHFAERRRRTNTDHFLNEGMKDEAEKRVQDLEAFMTDSRRQGSALGEGSTLTAEWTAETIIEKNGWALDRETILYRKLLSLIHRSQIEASRQERAEILLEPVQTHDETFSQGRYDADEARKREQAPLSLISVFNAYVGDAEPRERTAKAWRQHICQFIDFVGHDNVRRFDKDDFIAWKKQLRRDRGLAHNTINDAYLASLKATLNWAVEHNHIKENLAAKVRARSRGTVRKRDKHFTDDEAMLILAATTRPPPAQIYPERAFARRWVPWLCAFSGARVNEITQMRAEDVSLVDGIPAMLITPDAGTVKTNQSRLVPLHPQVLERGFFEQVSGKTGPLFFDPKRRRKTEGSSTQARKTGDHLANWVREIGVIDKNVQPNHAWRHRFKTLARDVGMHTEVCEFIQGHAPRTEGEAYGAFTIGTTLREIEKLPYYPIV